MYMNKQTESVRKDFHCHKNHDFQLRPQKTLEIKIDLEV